MKRSPRKGTKESAVKPRGTQEHLHRAIEIQRQRKPREWKQHTGSW